MRLRSWTLPALLLTLACGRTGLGTAHHDAGGSTASHGGSGGAASGPCGEASCLASLFQSCVPAGRCAYHGGGGPSAVASDLCYENGITVSDVGEWNGTNGVSTLTVSRRGTRCYTIQETGGELSSAFTYVISGPSGEVATAVTADKAGNVSVTCKGRQPILVRVACLNPVSTSADDCDLVACP